LKEKTRGERAEEEENNVMSSKKCVNSALGYVGIARIFITNSMTTATTAAARILKQPPSPFFTKTLKTANLSSHATPSLVRAPPAMGPVVLLL
jgi:hypothetical protein